MNNWQKTFLSLGIVAEIFLFAFPPQITMVNNVHFMLITYGYPIDWLVLFLWFAGIALVTGLGIAVNKDEHT
jgi:hypothetical protein